MQSAFREAILAISSAFAVLELHLGGAVLAHSVARPSPIVLP
jgi:hypothetical protein